MRKVQSKIPRWQTLVADTRASIATWTGAVDVRRVAPERRANVLLFEPRAYGQAIGVPRAVRKPRRLRSKRGFEGKGYAASSVVISPNSSQIAKFAMAAAALWPLSGLSLWNARVCERTRSARCTASECKDASGCKDDTRLAARAAARPSAPQKAMACFKIKQVLGVS